MTIVEYFKEWEGFDYFTEMSDDHSVYMKGANAKLRLRALARNNPILNEVCDKFIAYDKSLGQTELPKLNDYLLKIVY